MRRFLREVLYITLVRHQPVPLSTILYPGAIMAGWNLMLTGAAIVLGSVYALECRVTAGGWQRS
ncbi:hypothetical protein [Mycobacterium lepromatosis]|uniref:hypothetical protein n=1 Tax=Mycobacterium lepromatosis TaxID=480418 RepID=UPI000A5D338E|nr:hypothetical protein [Mycobacterium lepromatosis]